MITLHSHVRLSPLYLRAQGFYPIDPIWFARGPVTDIDETMAEVEWDNTAAPPTVEICRLRLAEPWQRWYRPVKSTFEKAW